MSRLVSSASFLLLALLLPWRNSGWGHDQSCPDFTAKMIGVNTTVDDGINASDFQCEGDDAYLSAMEIKWGWWIDALQFTCSDGSQSSWFANGLYPGETNTYFFGGGLVSVSAFIFFEVHPAVITLFGYDEEEGYPNGRVIGPYADFQENLTMYYSDEPETSDCGAGAYAIGINIYESASYVYGIQLQCRQIGNSTSCPASAGLLVPALVSASTHRRNGTSRGSGLKEAFELGG